MPPLPAAPKTYLPDSGATNLSVQRTETFCAVSCGAGENAPQSKLTSASVRTSVGSPVISRLLKYSPFRPAVEPGPLTVNADAATGVADTPILNPPGAYNTLVADETLLRMPASGVTDFDGVPL